MIVPGRRGDGIAPSPMNCGDDVARGGFFKAPQLRNVALTAPYFHNGSQLTLEQVVSSTTVVATSTLLMKSSTWIRTSNC